VKLIELVVELRNHLLDALAFLLDVNLCVDSPFDFPFVQQTFLDVSCKRLLAQHVLDGRTLVLSA